MKPFSRNELTATFFILTVVIIVSLLNMRVALRRSRDAQRKADLSAISEALYSYFDDFGFFPASDNGMIKACKGENFEKVLKEIKTRSEFDRGLFFEGLTACYWGQDSLADLDLFGDSATYLRTIPKDPRETLGIKYFYLSNTKRFQLYSYLEGEEKEEGYNASIIRRVLMCGNKLCSFGKSYAETPLDISIEEYEIELERKKKGL